MFNEKSLAVQTKIYSQLHPRFGFTISVFFLVCKKNTISRWGGVHLK